MKARVKSNIGRDGRTYEPGETIEVSVEEARSLARAGAIERIVERREREGDAGKGTDTGSGE